MPRQRTDVVLVARGLFESPARAQAAIDAGFVIANGKTVSKSSEMIADDADVSAEPAHPWVSRGGVKPADALERYPIDVEDRVCLDVGTSTAGFTEVLLNAGASLVHAIDVGKSQLHASLRDNPRILSREETDIRALKGTGLSVRPEIVVIDVSFISLKHVLPVVLDLAAAKCAVLALIKPQFEAERKHIKKGIVRDTAVHKAVCDDIATFAAMLGCTRIETFPSPIAGGDGNAEFFLGSRRA